MTALPKWTDDRTAQLQQLAGAENPVSKATVENIAAQLGTTPRSVASKLRKLQVEVERAGSAPRAFDEAQAEELRSFVEQNAGQMTYAQIAENFGGGQYSPKQIQGKILSMELTGSVAKTPKAETQKTYTPEEEQQVVQLVNSGAFVEDIAAQLGRPVPSIRGKALSLLRAGSISAMPQQRDVKGQAPDALEQLGDISAMNVADIAAQTGKTERGVKTMLTRRGISAADYDGAAKAEKARNAQTA